MNDDYVFLVHAQGGLVTMYREQLQESGIDTRTQSYSADVFSSLAGASILGEKIFVPNSQLDDARKLLNIEVPGEPEPELESSSTNGVAYRIVAALFVAAALLSLILFGF